MKLMNTNSDQIGSMTQVLLRSLSSGMMDISIYSLHDLGVSSNLVIMIITYYGITFLCLVLVERKAQCYRAYVCVRNTCCSCNMSSSVPHPTFLSTKSRITRVRNPLLLYRVVVADDTIFHITRHM